MHLHSHSEPSKSADHERQFFLHDDDGEIDHAHDDDHSANHHHVAKHGLSNHEAKQSSRNALRFAVVVTFLYALIEAAGGWYTGSLALMSDAGHMLTDSASLLIALFMAFIARRPASSKLSYGMGRAEVLGALVNSLFMLAVICFICFEAIRRLFTPEHVDGGGVILIASIGLIVNIIVAWGLSRGAHSLNSKAALVHVLGDLLGSVAAIVAGIIIKYTGYTIADPILSMFVALLLLNSTIRLLRQSLLVLMEGVPDHLDYNSIGRALANMSGVKTVHDLHVWFMSSDNVALSAHLGLENLEEWPEVLSRCQSMLSEKFAIDHVTLQPESHRKVQSSD